MKLILCENNFPSLRRTKKNDSREKKILWWFSGFKSSEIVNRNVKMNRCKCDMWKADSQCVEIDENMLKSRSSEEVKKVTKKKVAVKCVWVRIEMSMWI